MTRTFELLDSLPTQKDNKFLPPAADFETDFVACTTIESKQPYSEFIGDLNKSESDVREYRLIRLPNGMTAMVIHDATESKACAAMDVNVGSLADPPLYQGLAHFCEHLLFMGTSKYPKENEYSSYLSAHGGSSNAYTDLEDTCYYFDVTYDALEGALDRFSQFFIDPLFAPDCTDREVKAVDSEHKKNIQSDMWRQYQIEKELSSPNHPFSLFATGNYDTLSGSAKEQGVDLRAELLKFHAKYYSADIMKLVVVGRDSLDQLTEWTVAKFSPILSKGMTKPMFKGHPLTEKELGRIIRLKTVRQQRTLELTFSLPDIKPFYVLKPGRYLGSLLGHEGKGSVLSYLKKRGWATGVIAGRATTSAEGFDMFKITVHLTESGMEHYEDAIRAVFAYIQLLLAKGPQRWYQEELCRVSEIEYRFMEKLNAVNLAMNLANTMQQKYLPPGKILPDSLLVADFNEELLEWVQEFLNPQNFRILLAAHEIDVEFNKEEKYYGCKYRVDAIPAELMRDLRAELVFEELSLPGPNQFIPDNLAVKATEKAEEPAKEPELLRMTEGLELWFKQDDRFLLPRGNIQVKIETPRAYDSPLNAIFNQLFVLILNDILAEVTYDAQVAGLWFNVSETISGLSLQIDGFNDKLPQLLRILLETVKSFAVDDTQFETYSREVRKKLENAKHAEPYNHVQTNTQYLNQGTMWRYTDKQAVFGLVTKERLQVFVDTLFEQARVQMLVLGNFSEAEALAAADIVMTTMDTLPLPEYARRPARALLHNFGSYVHHEAMPDEANLNSSVDVSVYVGQTEDHEERVLMDLLLLIVQEPFFDQLRTKEQLGYLTYCTGRKYSGGPMSLRCIVQSESNPAYVTQRIAHFIRGFRPRLLEMTQEQFDKYANSLKVRLEEKLKNIFEEASQFWKHMGSGYYEFDKIDFDLAVLAGLKKEDVLRFWDMYVDPERACSVKLLTMTIWSAKIFRPSVAEMAMYPEIVIALHGCFLRDGAKRLTLEDVQEFVVALKDSKATAAAAAAASGIATGTATEAATETEVLQRVVELFKRSADESLSEEDLAKAVAKISEPTSYVRTALAMALESPPAAAAADHSAAAAADHSAAAAADHSADHSAAAAGGGSAKCNGGNGAAGAIGGDLANLGAVRTPGGSWAFEEASKYKSTLCLSGAPIPVRPLKPKYE